MATRLKQLTVNILFSAWLVVSVIIFILVNRVGYIQAFTFPDWQFFLLKLSQISFLHFLADLLLAFLGTGFFSLACTGLGLIALKPLKTPLVSDLAFGVTAFIAGEIILSLFFLSIISTASLAPATTYAAIIISLLAGAPSLWTFFRDLRLAGDPNRPDGQQRTILWWTIALLAVSLTLSTARLGYDAVSDYFSQAKLMAVTREASSFFPGNYMIVSSLHPDVLFTALIQLFGDQAARMLSWMNGLAILLMGYAIAKECGLSPRARAYYLILMVSSTAFMDLLGDGKVELICTAPLIAAMYWMQVSTHAPTRGVLLLIGFLAGFAIISRLYNIFLVPVFTGLFFGLWLITATPRVPNGSVIDLLRRASHLARPLLWMIPGLLLMGGFHLLQNWLWLGSPLAPLKFAPKLEASNWEWQFDPGALNILRILYPLTVTFLNSPQSLGDVSPLFAGFLPFLLVKDIRARIRLSAPASFLFWAGICTLILWLAFFYTVVEIRYVFFIWVLLFFPAAQLIEYSIHHAFKASAALMQLALAIVFAFTLCRVIAISLTTYSPIDAAGDAHCSDIEFCTFFEPVNVLAAPGDRVLALNAFRYYLRTDLLACSSRADEYPAHQTLARENSPDFWTEAYRQGFRFVTYERNFAVNHSRFGTIPDPRIAPAWLKISVISPSTDEDNTAYRIEAHDAPFQPDVRCEYDAGRKVWLLIDSSK
jgi:hypothetical protein